MEPKQTSTKDLKSMITSFKDSTCRDFNFVDHFSKEIIFSVFSLTRLELPNSALTFDDVSFLGSLLVDEKCFITHLKLF